MLSVEELYELADKRFSECIRYLENRVSHKFYKGVYGIKIYHQRNSERVYLQIYLSETKGHVIFIDFRVDKPTFHEVKFYCGRIPIIAIDKYTNVATKEEFVRNIESDATYHPFAAEYIKHLDNNYIMMIRNFITIKLQQLLTTNYLAHLNASYTLLLINKYQRIFPLDVLKIIIAKLFFKN